MLSKIITILFLISQCYGFKNNINLKLLTSIPSKGIHVNFERKIFDQVALELPILWVPGKTENLGGIGLGIRKYAYVSNIGPFISIAYEGVKRNFTSGEPKNKEQIAKRSDYVSFTMCKIGEKIFFKYFNLEFIVGSNFIYDYKISSNILGDNDIFSISIPWVEVNLGKSF